MEFTTLPTFRVIGISQTTTRQLETLTSQKLRQQWLASPPKIGGFSQTLYILYQYIDKDMVKITVGKLVSNDAMLPENLSDVWIAPQNYAVFTINHTTSETWQMIQNKHQLNRRFYIDFETYPVNSAAKIYIGLMSEVEIMLE